MNNNCNVLYIRNENNEKEYRTPIVPKDVAILITLGYTVYIESSKHRIFKDAEYVAYGAIITLEKWYMPMFKNALIIGLKDVVELDKLDNHNHMYFAHCYKKQCGYKKILNAFSSSSSKIYDFEYFVDNNHKRVISFGFYAGIAGCLLGLLQYIHKILYKKNISNIKYWNSIYDVLLYIIDNQYLLNKINISVIGAKGNCGKGVQYILQKLELNYTIIEKYAGSCTFANTDILYNCILLDDNYNEVWFDETSHRYNPLIITDISCDYSKRNNPIKLYNENTTWERPVYSYNKYIDIIAINNLPSLIPKESSTYFSLNCIELLTNKNEDTRTYWKNAEQTYYDRLLEL